MTASPTPPPDFFAESANKSEHHAESAYCSDHIVDADKMVPAGLPSEEEIRALVLREAVPSCEFADDGAPEAQLPDWRAARTARAILDLIRPAFEAKEREIEQACAVHANATIGWERERGRSEELEARALAAEAALSAERERCAKVAERVGNFGDYKREELTADFGQPRFDMMHEIAAAIRAQGE